MLAGLKEHNCSQVTSSIFGAHLALTGVAQNAERLACGFIYSSYLSTRNVDVATEAFPQHYYLFIFTALQVRLAAKLSLLEEVSALEAQVATVAVALSCGEPPKQS